MQSIAIAAAVLAIVVALGVRAVVRRLRRSNDPWTRADVDAYLDESELYDREQLEEMGLYDDLLEAAAAGEITDERAFEALCDSIVERGKSWESDVDDATDVGRSWKAHQEAKGRTPPVEPGDVEEFGVLEVDRHHSGSRRAVGKVEGFVLFVDDVPESVAEGDVVRAKVMHFNRGKTSATARFVEVVG